MDSRLERSIYTRIEIFSLFHTHSESVRARRKVHEARYTEDINGWWELAATITTCTPDILNYSTRS